MKKKLFSAVVALVALASCSENDFVGDSSLQGGGESPISFGFDVPTVTRASGADAATKLGNYFIVYGEKGETSAAKYNDGNQVFPNYTVHYTTNTAYTTTSNTKDWEYVAVAPISTANVKMSDGTTTSTAPSEQTIKYWDYGATSYTFTAISAKKEDIETGRVTIQKNTVGTSSVYDKGYTITLAKTTDLTETYPTLSDIYISDRLVINQSSGSDRNAMNAYGGNVTLTFRNLLSQVRAGVYETIPGYDITSIKFYVTGNAEATVGETPSTTPAFGAICPNVKIGGSSTGTLEVTYYESNQPKVAISGGSGSAADLILGTNMSTLTKATTGVLGKTAATPTWDTANGVYTNVLPQSVDNTTNLKLKCDYTLWNIVTGETIEVKGATAEIPSKYLQWKSNFKYTYLFKISDNTNGSTGQDVTGLYPITFDAVEMVNGDGIAEYITTVSEPSITTFGVKGGKYTSGKNDYEAGSDIYATFMDGSSVVDFTLGTNVNVYLATTADATNYPITEASVAESLAEISSGVKKITTVLKNADGTTSFTASPAKVTTVPGEDGVNKTINALKLTGAVATSPTTALVVEYIKMAATYHTETVTIADQTALTEALASGKLYTNADGTTEATTTYDSGVTYYRRTSVNSVGEYAYKVIRVVAAPEP